MLQLIWLSLFFVRSTYGYNCTECIFTQWTETMFCHVSYSICAIDSLTALVSLTVCSRFHSSVQTNRIIWLVRRTKKSWKSPNHSPHSACRQFERSNAPNTLKNVTSRVERLSRSALHLASRYQFHQLITVCC